MLRGRPFSARSWSPSGYSCSETSSRDSPVWPPCGIPMPTVERTMTALVKEIEACRPNAGHAASTRAGGCARRHRQRARGADQGRASRTDCCIPPVRCWFSEYDASASMARPADCRQWRQQRIADLGRPDVLRLNLSDLARRTATHLDRVLRGPDRRSCRWSSRFVRRRI